MLLNGQFAVDRNHHILGLDPAEKDKKSDSEYYYYVSHAFRKRHTPSAGKSFSLAVTRHEIEMAFHELLTNNSVYQRIHRKRTDEEFVDHISDFVFSLYDINKIIQRSHEIQANIEALPELQRDPELEKYASFIALADNLDYYYFRYLDQAIRDSQQRYRRYDDLVIYNWRMAILGFLGEERLSDFDMRDMIAFGIAWENLATRKLVNPLKWIGLGISLAATAYIALVKWLKFHVAMMLIGEHHILPRSDMTSKVEYASKAAQTAAFVISALMVAILFPTYVLNALIFVYGLAVLFKNAAHILSNPINDLFRPVLNFVYEHPYVSMTFLVYKVGMLLLTLIACLCIPPLAAFLAANDLNMIGLSILFGLPSSYLTRELNREAPGTGYFLGSVFSCSLFLMFAGDLMAVGGLITNPVAAIAFLAMLFGVAETIIDLVVAEKKYNGNIAQLPKPRAKTDVSIKDIIQGAGVNLTFCSHELYSTPSDSEVVEEKDRDWQYQLRSAFGLPMATRSA